MGRRHVIFAICCVAIFVTSLAARDEFDDNWQRYKQGRAYAAEKTGSIHVRFPAGNGVEFDNVVEVPDDYSPSTKWPLRVQLHGGVARPGPQAAQAGRPVAQSAPNRIPGEKQIYVYPSGWADAQWWDTNQVDNILRVINEVKQKYNVDESLIYLTGISDGATGAYYIAMKEPTVWSSVLPLNGSIAVLRNPQNGADGELYGNNLVNKPIYIVNGEEDQLYPVWHVEPHVRWFVTLGVTHDFRPQPGAGHNTNWWPTEREPFEKFVHANPRQPHPAKLSWETERIDRFNRVHWLVINKIGKGTSEAALPDQGFFQHRAQSGRVDVERNGNVFEAKARGVREFTLLVSPDVVDFGQPVVVNVNGKELFRNTVKRDLTTLVKWATRDNDRTMLYGAEVRVVVP
jgi:predicted esterase